MHLHDVTIRNLTIKNEGYEVKQNGHVFMLTIERLMKECVLGDVLTAPTIIATFAYLGLLFGMREGIRVLPHAHWTGLSGNSELLLPMMANVRCPKRQLENCRLHTSWPLRQPTRPTGKAWRILVTSRTRDTSCSDPTRAQRWSYCIGDSWRWLYCIGDSWRWSYGIGDSCTGMIDTPRWLVL